MTDGVKVRRAMWQAILVVRVGEEGTSTIYRRTVCLQKGVWKALVVRRLQRRGSREENEPLGDYHRYSLMLCHKHICLIFQFLRKSKK